MTPITPPPQKKSANSISSANINPAVNEEIMSLSETIPVPPGATHVSKEAFTNFKEQTITVTNNTRLSTISVIPKEQFIQAAFENAFIGVVVIDPQGIIIQSNTAFNNLTGYNVNELAGTKLTAIIHTESIKDYTTFWDGLLDNKDYVAAFESRFLNRSNQPVWIRNSFTLIKDQEGKPENILLLCVNINEEKRAQQKAGEITARFRFLADSMPQQIWTADANGNLNYFSHAFYEYSGLTYKDIKNSNWFNIVSAEDLNNTCRLWDLAVKTGEEFVIEHRLKRRDGNYTWQLSRGMAHKDIDGKIIMWVGTTSNIHRQKTVEEELEKQVLERTRDLQQANFNLKHSNHDLEQFAYIATHDLQEPLRKIRTYSSWINKKYFNELSEEAQNYMLNIENASKRMSVLIDDLLNYSLLLRPQESFEIADLNIILQKVIQEFASMITEKNVVINYAELPQLRVIPMQVYQLFYNLLSNALKFTADEILPVIDITSRVIGEEEVIALALDIDMSYIEIVFKDNGVGFRQEYAEKIFAIFQRLHNRNKYPGTGIGLALCQKIAVYHHGRIYARSNESEGASFYILLPLKSNAAIDDPLSLAG